MPTSQFYPIVSTRYLLQWLNPSDQDFLIFAAGGNLLERSAQDVLKIIKNKSKVHNSRNKPIFSQVKASNVDSSEIASAVASAVTSAMTAMFKQHQVTPAPASVKAVEELYVTCGGAHSYRQCPAIDGNTFSGYQDNIQGYVSAAAANDAVMKNMQTQMTSLTNSNIELKNMFGQFMKMNTASTSGLGSLPSNTIANPRVQIQAPIDKPIVAPKPKPSIPYPSRANKQKLREKDDLLASKFVEIFRELHFKLSFADVLLHMPKFATMFKSLLNNKEKLFELATTTSVNENCSEFILKNLPEKLGDPGKFLIPCDFPELDECLDLADLGASINLMPLSIWKKISLPELTPMQMILELADRSTTRPAGIAEDVFVKVGKFHFPTDFVVVDYVVDPRVPLILERPFLRTRRALIDVYGEELNLCHDDEAVTFKVGQTSRYVYNDVESINQIDVIDVACGEYAQEVLGFLEISTSGNPTSEPIISTSSPTLTPFGDNDFLLEEADAFLAIEDDSISLEIDDSYYDSEGDIQPKTKKSSINDPSKFELKDLPSHLEYAFLEGTDKLPIIIAKDLKEDEKTKRRPPLLALMGRLPTDVFPSAYVMLRARSKGHKISKSRIEVDKAKVDVIAKLPHPNSVKGIRSFLGHAGFYRRFIQDVSKNARPMTHLLEKDTPFIFSKECVESFNILKKKLIEAPILVAPDWDLPFEIMCDASDYAVGVENLAADHISRLENPHQDVLENKEITKTFPLETLGMVTFRGDDSTPMDLADFCKLP
ncbi:reverse transcriptase domain-containing protein [Tanacetum coccineum]|uniref:Reverse transcriptase domain-containing protein n=1 Tax=Tanacetum coccineum TaxID=301880 RepID=A0ABQ5CM87_9ASTR